MKNKLAHPQLWLIRVGEHSKHLESATLNQLNDSGLRRLQQFKSVKRRRQFLLSRWLISKAISHHFFLPYSCQNIIEKPDQVPELGKLPHRMFYSLSHSDDWITFIMAETPVGIDIETMKTRPNAEQMADTFMSSKELDKFQQSLDLTLFYRYWCRKEAYFKSRSTADQKKLLFNEIDTDLLAAREASTLFEMSSKNYYLSAYFETAVPRIDCFEVGSQPFFQQSDKLTDSIEIHWQALNL